MFENCGKKVKLCSKVLSLLMTLAFIIFIAWCVFMILNKQVFMFMNYYWLYWVLIPIALIIYLLVHILVILPLYTIGDTHEKMLDTKVYVKEDKLDSTIDVGQEFEKKEFEHIYLNPEMANRFKEEDKIATEYEQNHAIKFPEEAETDEVVSDYVEELNKELSALQNVKVVEEVKEDLPEEDLQEVEEEVEEHKLSDRDAQLEMINGVLSTLHGLGIDENTEEGREIINNIHTIAIADGNLILETVDKDNQERLIVLDNEKIPNLVEDDYLLNVSLKVFTNLKNVRV